MVVTILCYYFRDHVFDLPLRVRGKKKRKASSVSQPNKPARGIMPVRQFHKVDESKILPHVRRGISLQ